MTDRIRRPHPRKTSPYETRLAYLLRASAPAFVTQHKFASEIGRNFRFDFAWPSKRIAAEVDGGGRLVKWQRNPRTGRSQPVAVGRHGTKADYEKLNIASQLGWRVFRFNPDMLRDPNRYLAPLLHCLSGSTEAPDQSR